MLASLSVVQDTLTQTQDERFVTSGTHQATGRCRLGSFLQSSKNLLLGTRISPAECCAPVWCRSAQTKHIDVPFNESIRVIIGCLRSIPSSFLPISSGITTSETRHSPSCLKLYTKAFNPKYLPHETLYLKSSPKLLRSTKPPRSFVELLSINGEPTTPIPPALQSFIPAFGPQPPGCDLPRNTWVQLNLPRTGVGRFGTNMKLMGLCGSDLYECGKVQTAHHILRDGTKFKPPCHIDEVDKPAILEYLTQSKF